MQLLEHQIQGTFQSNPIHTDGDRGAGSVAFFVQPFRINHDRDALVIRDVLEHVLERGVVKVQRDG